MSHYKEYNFQDLGINLPLKLFGDSRILCGEQPIVFLIDENHDNLNSCIDRNIQNAKELITNANVEIIGVESLAGGKEWDEETQNYVTDDCNEKYYKEVLLKQYKNNCPKFANDLCENYRHLIVGVESIGMTGKIEMDFQKGNPFYEQPVSSHPLHKERSKHFIKTLFEYYNSRQLIGNLILNCGSNHNSDIEEWIRNGEIDAIANHKASYVRLNAFED